MRKIAVFTGTRAEYGLLKPLLQQIEEDETLSLKLIVGEMPLSRMWSYTYKQIEKDGWSMVEKVEMLLSSDSHVGVTKSFEQSPNVIDYPPTYEEIIKALEKRYSPLSKPNTSYTIKEILKSYDLSTSIKTFYDL